MPWPTLARLATVFGIPAEFVLPELEDAGHDTSPATRRATAGPRNGVKATPDGQAAPSVSPEELRRLARRLAKAPPNVLRILRLLITALERGAPPPRPERDRQ